MSCSLCKKFGIISKGVNKSTCPLNPKAKNKDYLRHKVASLASEKISRKTTGKGTRKTTGKGSRKTTEKRIKMKK